MKDIYDILREVERRPNENYALATLICARGSSYRRPGARMLICEDGATLGSLSGGCLEEEVALRAREVLRTGEQARMTFDTRKRFGCNGAIDIFLERVAEGFFRELRAQLQRRCSCRIVTGCRGSRIEHDHDHEHEHELVQEIHPPIRLLIFGEGPDSALLHSLAWSLGWETMEFADANAFEIAPDEWTAAIVKSHNYGRDFVALQKLLPLNLRYVGLVGPRQRRDQLLNALLDIGVTINPGFFAPAGLDLRAETPEEIALAIVAEIQRGFVGGSGASLRERRNPIHQHDAPMAPACEKSLR